MVEAKSFIELGPRKGKFKHSKTKETRNGEETMRKMEMVRMVETRNHLIGIESLTTDRRG